MATVSSVDSHEEKADNKSAKEEAAEEEEVVREIEASDLAVWIEGQLQRKDEKTNTKYAIIDVRDDDYGPHKIIGAINIAKHKLLDEANQFQNLRNLIANTKHIQNIIFHCRYSMVRGPTSAKYYFEFRRKNFPNYTKQKVLVLRGGFAFWQQQHPKLCQHI
eukprot:CAMPEP_0202692818 /NCGR_PEP_ID=MMETSP1385-20130828/7108_1 /ASSEMBLY_ACC=CAM_ASM_000861 /TAXON_ID=933848 /ORGANISM="Elphidium margaritaceum" /LENGTH=161 /DNA_ID=CAMNT_0049348415 /DNA_START=35 /DNA_END=520 /DNA_ORIENTATION=-